jgi:hypothetical protein
MADTNSGRLRLRFQGVVLLATFACSISFASIFDFLFSNSCNDTFRGISYVHGVITKRSEGHVLNALDTFDASVRPLKSRSPFWEPYSTEAIKNGDRSLLSLGEGESDFLAKTIRYRHNKGLSYQNLHAVDAAYFTHIAEIDPDFAAKHPYGFRAAELRNYPNHYHGQRFDELNLKDSSGRPMLFKEIISGNSLSYVLKASQAGMKEKIIRKIALHAAKRAILRFWNIKTSESPASQKINETLQELKESRVILDFGYVSDFSLLGLNQEGWYVIFP